MPIVTFHLVEGQYSVSAMQRLLVESCQLYSRVLDAPVDRTRAFVDLHPPELTVVAGDPVSEVPSQAPYFEFVVLAGRSLQQRHDLLRSFTDLLVETLEAPRELVRGQAVEVEPDNWAIGGEPASVRRTGEIKARAATTSTT